MRRFPLLLVAIFAAGVFVSACQGPATQNHSRAVPSPDPARAAQLPPTDLAEGRRLCEVKCTKCHQFYNPADYDDRQWNVWMHKMSRKAHLAPEEEHVLAAYLNLFRSPPQTPPGA